jgi:hypothetical protein
MKNRDFETTINWTVKPEHMETPRGVSMTVPDQSLTLKEILEKSLAGQDLSYWQRNGWYGDNDADYDSDDAEQFARMDIAEQYDYVSAVIRQEEAAKIGGFESVKIDTLDGAGNSPA